jgi:hypothetical protein
MIDERTRTVAEMTTKGYNQTRIAEILGISKQRVGQIIDKAALNGIHVVRKQLKYRSCPNCGEKHRQKRLFCSLSCRLSMSPPKFGGPASSIEVEVIVCDGCGTKFSRTRRLTYIGMKTAQRNGKTLKRKFCTRDCYHKNGIGKT